MERQPAASRGLTERGLTHLARYLRGPSRYVDDFAFQRRLRRAGAGQARTIRSWTNRRELRVLFDLAAGLPHGAVALEIGSYLGASACYLAAGIAEVGGHLFCVDTWRNETMPDGVRDTFAEFQVNTHGVRRCITAVRKSSGELSKADIQIPLSLVFIDGDHAYACVKHDFERVQDWTAESGIVAFHDFANRDYEGVSRVVGEALASGQWMMVGLEDRLAWIRRASWSMPRSAKSP
jgi:predicted O-methyltransferase YrrM